MPKKHVNVESAQVVFTVEPRTEGGEPTVITFDLSKVDGPMRDRLALHGAAQKIGDSYAGAKESGEDPIAYAEAAINDTIKQLYAEEHGGLNKWSVTRTGTGAPRTSLLVQAFAQVSGKSLEEAQEIVSQLNDEEKKELQGKKKIAAAIAAIRAEQAVARAKKAAEEAAKEDEADVA